MIFGTLVPYGSRDYSLERLQGWTTSSGSAVRAGVAFFSYMLLCIC